MKLRTRDGSIRFRLGKTEVSTLAEAGAVTETVHFGPSSSIEFSLVTTDVAKDIVATLQGARITVQIPTGLARAWAASNDVGMNAEQPVAGRSPLVILIEKDFACLEPRGDEDKDAFPHPGSPSGTC